MTANWRVVDLTGYSRTIQIRRGRLVIGEQSLPLDDVACILTETDTQWSGGLVSLAAKHDVIILACDWRGIPLAATLPWGHNSRIGARYRAQADLSVPREKNAWMRVVRAKIEGQASNLDAVAPASAKTLRRLAADVRSGDPANIEAQAARTYWSRYLPDEPFSRTRGGGGRNDLLNYGYTIIRSLTLRAILLAGISPTLGIWHSNRSNPFALADDLMEPFRPAVDHVVRRLPASADLTQHEIKNALVAVATLPMSQSGATVGTVITDLAQAFARYVEGHESRLHVAAWDSQSG
jgi:CRISPR-associated protein Cas1